MSKPVVYGIKNCDTVRAARRWLKEHKVDHAFHDFRADGLDAATVQRWLKHCAWEELLNRRGRTWRQLSEDERAGISKSTAIDLMLREPTLIKRPVVESGSRIEIGFSPAAYRDLFSLN